jgi:hypothetical protein
LLWPPPHGQSPFVLQPQLPDTQAVPLLHPLVVQSVHAPPLVPLVPQLAAAVPLTQLPEPAPLQHPPLHAVCVLPPQPIAQQVTPQRCAAVSQASNNLQCAWSLQPHVPPTELLMHCWLSALVAQSAHMPPVSPHAISVVPATHVVPLQQPVSQGDPGSAQLPVHTLPMQDFIVAGRQSAVTLHSTHVAAGEQYGFAVLVQTEHMPPPVPQAPAVVPG